MKDDCSSKRGRNWESRMTSELNVLVIEDNEDDFFFIKKSLMGAEHYGFSIEREVRLADGLEKLEREEADLILLDLSLPDSFGYETFEKVFNAFPKIPIVILTGSDDTSLGLRAVQAGAQEFLTKGTFSGQTLVMVLKHANERQKLLRKLQDALNEVQTLRGIIPICMHCKSIRDDKGYWQQVEKYVSTHSDAQFSHGICPACMKRHYPDIAVKND